MSARLAQKLKKRAISQKNNNFPYLLLSQLTNNETFYEDKLKWTKIFEDANCPAIPVPDMTPIKYQIYSTGEKEEEFDVNITEEEIHQIKDSNGMIRFMNVM